MNKDLRKSLAHGAIENANDSFTGQNRRRSSFYKAPPSVDIYVNNDDAERAEFRDSSSSNRRSIYQDTVANMSSPQVVEGITQCIKLNTQNKITMKNAFSLNMIDLMTWIVRHKESDMSNLQMAAVGLDISAKIYALRVDRLHQDILAMAGNLDPQDNQTEKTNEEMNSENDPEATEEDANSQQKKKKKKKRNLKIFTTVEALQGECETISLAPTMCGEVDCQNSKMLYQKMLPQHCTGDYALSLYNDVIIDEFKGENQDKNETTIPWPPLQVDFSREFNPMFPDFSFLAWSSEQVSSQDTSQSHQSIDNLAFDLDASLLPDEPNDQDMNFVEMNDDDDENMVACQAQPMGPIRRATLANVLDQIPNKPLEYSLFNNLVDIRWAGPSHWKIKTFINNKETSKVRETCTQNPMKKKKVVLNFSEEVCKEVLKKLKVTKKCTMLKPSTIKYSWSEGKITGRRETPNIVLKEMRTFFLRPDVYINSTYNQRNAAANDRREEYDYNDLNDTMNNYPGVENDDVFPNNDISNEIIDNDIPQTQTGVVASGFVGDNLLEAPKLTQKINIPYVQRAKRLDVRHLKKCIWKELTSDELEDQENQQLNDKNQNNQNHNESTVANPDTPTVKGEKSFAQIFGILPNKLNKNDAQELSFSIAFVSLLHLANEKDLELKGNEDYSDITIKQ